MPMAKHAFQETCRDMYAFVTSAAIQGHRQMSLEERTLVDPATQKEIKNRVVGDVAAKLEPNEGPLRERILRIR